MKKIIVLNDVEMKLARIAGQARYEQNKINHIVGDHDLDFDIRGMAGEIAACKYFNVYPDLRIGPNRLGHDLKYKDLKIDVKCTKYTQGWLSVGLNHRPQFDFLYMLCCEVGREYTLVGWQWSETILQDSYKTDRGYVMEQSMLRDIEEIK
jgi:hypothetical protein